MRYEPEEARAQQQDHDAPQKRFKVFSVSELLALPPPEYDFHELIQERTLAVMVGQPGCGKSFLAVHLACAMVAGLPFYGERATKRGAVVYVCAEGSPAKFGRRIVAALKHRGIDPATVSLFVIPQPVQLIEARRRIGAARNDSWS